MPFGYSAPGVKTQPTPGSQPPPGANGFQVAPGWGTSPTSAGGGFGNFGGTAQAPPAAGIGIAGIGGTAQAPQSQASGPGFQLNYGQPQPAPVHAPGSYAGTFAPGIQGRVQTPMGNPNPAPGTATNGAPGEMYGPQFGEKYGMSHIGQYDQPTSLETFAQQQLNGNNPYYDRLRQQGMDQINQQMIARGHGNSGGALAALGNFQGALGAEQFKDMGNLLQGAGSMGLNREGQGQNTANQIQGMQDTRVQHQFGNLSDLAHLGAGNVGGFYGQGGQQSGDAAMAGINAGVNASQLTGQGQGALPNTIMSLLNGALARK